MRKLIVALVAVGLLAVAAPAMAQPSGLADPLGLIASGAVIPFFGTGSISLLEVYSPVGDNSGIGGVGGLHMLFFDASCTKNPGSVGLPLTTNDFAIARIDNQTSSSNGLVTIGAVDASGKALTPLDNPFHARMLWFFTGSNTMRVLEPISAAHAEDDFYSWNPLRTGAAFFAPLEGTAIQDFHTTLYLVCPNSSVLGRSSSALSTTAGFPALDPAYLATSTVNPQLLVRVYGANEVFLRDADTNCSCLTVTPIPSIHGIGTTYSDPSAAPDGTFTEMEGNTVGSVAAVCDTTQVGGPSNAAGDCFLDPTTFQPCVLGDPTCTQFLIVTPSRSAAGPIAFTGYRSITISGIDIFGRLSNGSRDSLRGSLTGETGFDAR